MSLRGVQTPSVVRSRPALELLHAMKAAAYVSVASNERRNGSLAPAEQRRRVVDYIQARGWALATVYEDLGPAAKPGRRVAFNELLGSLQGLDRVVVASLDRIGTSPLRIRKVLSEFDRSDVGLVSLAEDIDTCAESGRALLGVIDLFLDSAPKEPTRAWKVASGWQTENLRSFGLDPPTLIDVGAGSGTAEIYEAFPLSHLVLIEPLVEFKTDLEGLVRERHADYLPVAVGDEIGTAELRVNRANQFMSSFLTAELLPDHDVERRRVPITTLDALFAEGDWRAPFGLKLDIEGFEHRVISGAGRLLEDTEFVIAETSLSKRFHDSCTSKELIGLMLARGFQVADILYAGPSPLGVHADVLFTRIR